MFHFCHHDDVLKHRKQQPTDESMFNQFIFDLTNFKRGLLQLSLQLLWNSDCHLIDGELLEKQDFYLIRLTI